MIGILFMFHPLKSSDLVQGFRGTTQLLLKILLGIVFIAITFPALAQQRGPQSHDVQTIVVEGMSIAQPPEFVESLDALREMTVQKTGIVGYTIRRQFAYLRELTITENTAMTGIGDIQLSAGRRLIVSKNSALVTINDVKLAKGHNIFIADNAVLMAIQDCDFSKVDDSISIIRNPNLDHIDCGSFPWAGVEVLNLSNNKLDDRIWSLLPSTPSQLWKLNISNNAGVTTLPDSLAWSRIDELELWGTGLTSVPAAIPYMLDLTRLTLGETCIPADEYKLFYNTFISKIGTITPAPASFTRGSHCP